MSSSSDTWKESYRGKRVTWTGTYERPGTLVEFVASTGDTTAMSCKSFAKAHDPAKFKGVVEHQAIEVDGKLEKKNKQMGKDKTEFILVDCAARIVGGPTEAPVVGSASATDGWSKFPALENGMLWALTGSPPPGKDEFERRASMANRDELQQRLKSSAFVFTVGKDRIEFGDYDFKRSAFPFAIDTVSNDNGAPHDDKVDWYTCACTSPKAINPDKWVNSTRQFRVYQWTAKPVTEWVPVPEADAPAFRKRHGGSALRGEKFKATYLVRFDRLARDSHYFVDSEFKSNSSTGGIAIFKRLGPVRITGRDGEVLLDTLDKYPEVME